MTGINLKGFRGKVPRTNERLLQGNYATEALNCRITSGGLEPVRGLLLSHPSAIAGAIQTMHRYRNADIDYWLVWNKTVDVVRSPTAQDAKNRVYWTGDGEPKMAAFSDAISGAGPYPAAWFVLGVYVPTVAPTVGVTGGTGTEIRSYVYTFVTPYGEESGPSPAAAFTGTTGATSWNLSGMEAPPPNTGTVAGAAALSSTTVRVTLNTNRGLSEFEEVTFAGVTGMTDLNGTFRVAPVAGSTTQVDVALATAQTYSAGGTWARRAPHNTIGMKRRIYRTVGTNTDYKFVAEMPDATVTTYTDTVASANVTAAITTLLSFPPPKNGHSIVALANGAHAMLAGNQLCISEQYKPYSYPQANRYTFSGTGIAAVAAGNSVIVATDERPVVFSASVPEAASPNRLPTSMPCMSKPGAVDIGGAMVYPSNEGLILLTPSSAQNLTEKLYRNREWRNVTAPTFRAAYYDQTYIAAHTDAASGQQRLFMLDTNEPDSIVEIDEDADGLYANPFDGRLYVSQGNKIYEFDADDSRRYLTFWQSAEFQFGPAVKLTTAQVHAKYDQIVPPDTSVEAANAALLASGADAALGAFGTETGIGVPWGGTNMQEVQSATANRVQFMLLQNGQVVFATDLNSSEPFRCEVDERAEIYQVQIAASIPVHSVTVAQGIRELGKLSA